jgi:hypothetical protein
MTILDASAVRRSRETRLARLSRQTVIMLPCDKLRSGKSYFRISTAVHLAY